MSRCFADTFFFLALLDKRDGYHARVAAFAAQYKGKVYTTRWVLAEAANSLGVTPGREKLALLLQTIERQTGFSVIRNSDDLYERGVDLYVKRPDKQWSLTDCISFAAMDESDLSEALTGDRHFAQAGFVPLFAE